jgi:hypothetical protein
VGKQPVDLVRELQGSEAMTTRKTVEGPRRDYGAPSKKLSAKDADKRALAMAKGLAKERKEAKKNG